jgi:hypothetical protein
MRHIKYINYIVFIFISCISCNKNTKSDVKEISNDKITNKNNLEIDSNKITLSSFIITNETFKNILDITLEEYNNCDNVEKGYYFYISIHYAIVKDSAGTKCISVVNDSIDTKGYAVAKSIYISRSYYKEFVSRGYGFFYYKGYLFILVGEQLIDIFKKTNNVKKFLFKDEPIEIFDPPRWWYCFWNEKFYFAHGSPSGG